MHTETVVLRQSCRQVPATDLSECKNLSVEQVQNWLEREDSAVDLLVGYGLCCLTALYLLGCVVRGLLG